MLLLGEVVRRWRRQAHQISAEAKETQFGSSETLTPERYANLVKPLEGGQSEQARDIPGFEGLGFGHLRLLIFGFRMIPGGHSPNLVLCRGVWWLGHAGVHQFHL